MTQLIPLVDSIPPIAGKVGHPIQRPGELFGDRAYDSNPHREQLRQRGIEPTIAERNTEHGSGLGILRMILAFLRAFFASRATLVAENVMLRQQLIVLQRSVKRTRILKRDRILWSWLLRLWSGWRSALLIVQPATVVRWHRQGFKLHWRWESRRRPGRPKVDREIRHLIRRMSQENPTWGAPRILSELLLLARRRASVAAWARAGKQSPSCPFRRHSRYTPARRGCDGSPGPRRSHRDVRPGRSFAQALPCAPG